VNYQKMNNSRLPEIWAGETERVPGEQARVLGEQTRVPGETERILGEQAYEDVLATVIINKVNRFREKVLGSMRASSKIISLPAEKEFFLKFQQCLRAVDVKNYQSLVFGCFLKLEPRS
jgi:hypothetical protein